MLGYGNTKNGCGKSVSCGGNGANLQDKGESKYWSSPFIHLGYFSLIGVDSEHKLADQRFSLSFKYQKATLRVYICTHTFAESVELSSVGVESGFSQQSIVVFLFCFFAFFFSQ
jgi:hypothetical protein